MDATRQLALRKLLEEHNPWIANPTELDKIVIALTRENKPQKIQDMERLYHSCRLEREVTKETIIFLKVSYVYLII